MKLILKAKSSSDQPYDVTFQFKDGFLSAHCTCKAAIFGTMCKHRLALLRGDNGMLAALSQAEDLAKIAQWVDQTGFTVLLQQLDAAEAEVSHAQLEFKRLKKRIEESMTRGHKRQS